LNNNFSAYENSHYTDRVTGAANMLLKA